MKTLKEMIFIEKPTANCHASTVLPLADGSVVAAWFGGTEEGKDDVAIWFSKRVNDVWSKPCRVAAREGIPHWNPVLFLREDGVVRLFFKVGKKVRFWRTYVCESNDGGVTFDKPLILVKGDYSDGRGPVKNKIIRLSNGNILAPASSEIKGWFVFADMSDDDGLTWHRQRRVKTAQVAPGADSGNGICRNAVAMIQPTLWEYPEGCVHMLTRTSSGFIYRSDSTDYGKSWCRAYQTELPNNNSGIDLVKTDDNELYLVWNPVGENWGERSPLILSRSRDNGESFETVMTLEDNPGGEYSYPAIEYRDGKLHITYTYDRECIAYWQITL